MNERYFVDRRCGCIAVRDRDRTDMDYPGLHWDTRGVVWYRHGKPAVCECCKQPRSDVGLSGDDIIAAEEIAALLNKHTEKK